MTFSQDRKQVIYMFLYFTKKLVYLNKFFKIHEPKLLQIFLGLQIVVVELKLIPKIYLINVLY